MYKKLKENPEIIKLFRYDDIQIIISYFELNNYSFKSEYIILPEITLKGIKLYL